MLVYHQLRDDRRQFLALTGLTVSEFQRLLPAFQRVYRGHHPPDQTADGRPRQRDPGAGRPSAMHAPEQKLLLILVYLRTYPLQSVMAALFDLSVPRVNFWIHHLMPVLREALDELGVLPPRDPQGLAPETDARMRPTLILDGTERRRQRPKSPEKQALHYSGKKKAHTDKNLVVADARTERICFLGRTRAGTVHDKRMADEEHLVYPPGASLQMDAGFQGYDPPVRQVQRAKKKGTRPGTHRGGEGSEPRLGAGAGTRRTRAVGGEA